MRLATQTTILGVGLCVLISAALGVWIERRFAESMETIAVNTTLFVGNQIGAVLHEPMVDALLSRHGRSKLVETLESASERSVALLSIDVMDANGKVLVSDDDDAIGKQRTPAESVFSEARVAKVLERDEDFFENRRTRLAVPLIREGSLDGYLTMLVKHDEIEGLYRTFYASLTTVVLCALVAVLLLGALLQLQMSRLGSQLVAAIEASLSEDAAEPIVVTNEFADVQEAAMRVGAELRAARGEAQSARRELNVLANVTKVGVLLLDADGEPIYITDAAKDLLADEQFENLADRLAELRPAIDSALAQLSEKPQLPVSTEVAAPSSGGELHLEFLSLSEEQWRGCLVIVKDRALMEALEIDLQAATRLRGLNTLYLGATHDIRSPLNAINMNIELLSQGLSDLTSADPEKLKRWLGVIRQELERLQRRLEALIRHAAPLDDEERECELVDTVNGLLSLLEAQAKAQRIKIETKLCEPPVHVRAPAFQIRQALMNLLVNAIEAMPQGGALTIEMACAERMVEVNICDSGAGIPGALARKIFDMHFTTKSTGTGVGLYVVREIVERHEGTIAVTSALGEGTRATLTLPVAKSSAKGEADLS